MSYIDPQAENQNQPNQYQSEKLHTREILLNGEIEIHGRIPQSSNVTLLVTCSLDGSELLAVYKPIKGERPLSDFHPGLYYREIAAYELSELLGWDLVPETLERKDAPFGPGSVQRYVPEDGISHYFSLREDLKWREILKKICTFDVIANNSDRKSGHVLLAQDRIWAIDNGLCFHRDDKLRTVIWDFGGEIIEENLVNDLKRVLTHDIHSVLGMFIDVYEEDALIRRVKTLLEIGHLPILRQDRQWPPYPWPLV